MILICTERAKLDVWSADTSNSSKTFVVSGLIEFSSNSSSLPCKKSFTKYCRAICSRIGVNVSENSTKETHCGGIIDTTRHTNKQKPNRSSRFESPKRLFDRRDCSNWSQRYTIGSKSPSSSRFSSLSSRVDSAKCGKSHPTPRRTARLAKKASKLRSSERYSTLNCSNIRKR